MFAAQYDIHHRFQRRRGRSERARSSTIGPQRPMVPTTGRDGWSWSYSQSKVWSSQVALNVPATRYPRRHGGPTSTHCDGNRHPWLRPQRQSAPSTASLLASRVASAASDARRCGVATALWRPTAIGRLWNGLSINVTPMTVGCEPCPGLHVRLLGGDVAPFRTASGRTWRGIFRRA